MCSFQAKSDQADYIYRALEERSLDLENQQLFLVNVSFPKQNVEIEIVPGKNL